MSPLKFCANLNFLYTDKVSICDRLIAASRAGFKGVEASFLYDNVDIEEYAKVQKKTGLTQVLINAYPGDMKAGDFGLLAMPGRETEFENSVTKSLSVAQALNCKRIHFMSGKVPIDHHHQQGQQQSIDLSRYYKTLETNLEKLLPKLEEVGIMALIEPINPYTIPGYILNDFDKALAIVKRFSSPLIRLQLDIFHLQQIHGSLTARITELLPFVGHIQIAQVPLRNEPDIPGEIDYAYIFGLISRLGYEDWIGLEYNPLNDTDIGLGWLPKFGFTL